MKIATIVLAGAMSVAAVSSALADDARKGMVTGVNRLTNTVAIQETQQGTVGASTKGAPQSYKVQSGLSLEDWHAGDLVTFTTSGDGDARTVTKIQKQ
jgi:hypothetical protein